MKLTPTVHVVGGGRFGFGISGALDCHVYLLNGGDELALIDPGLGLAGDFDRILDNIRADGLDPRRIRKLILTHYHCDHVGAAAEAQKRLDLEVYTSALSAPVIRTGDERAVSLDIARKIGFYPADFVLAPCPVDHEVDEGDVIRVGELALTAYDTPGHCDGHLSFHITGGDRVYLLGADLVFWGGRVLLQTIHDCRIDAYAESVFKVEKLDFEALLPGHLQISLSGGKEHIDLAATAFRRFAVLKPPTVSCARSEPAPTPATPPCAFSSLGWHCSCKTSGCWRAGYSPADRAKDGTNLCPSCCHSQPFASCSFAP